MGYVGINIFGSFFCLFFLAFVMATCIVHTTCLVMLQKLPACQGHYSECFTFKGFVSRYTFPTGHPSEKKSEDELKVNWINQIYLANFDVKARGVAILLMKNGGD